MPPLTEVSGHRVPQQSDVVELPVGGKKKKRRKGAEKKGREGEGEVRQRRERKGQKKKKIRKMSLINYCT